MNKKSKTQSNRGLEKEHFEILLENIDDKLKVVSEGYTLLNNKVDNLGHELHTEIRETRQELIFLIKATVERSEERLTKKIEDGDNAVRADLSTKIEDTKNTIIEYTDHKIEGVKTSVNEYTDHKIEGVKTSVNEHTAHKIEGVKTSVNEHTDQKIDEVKEILRAHADKLDDHDGRLSKLEHRG